jgi:hypothetical protein
MYPEGEEMENKWCQTEKEKDLLFSLFLHEIVSLIL